MSKNIAGQNSTDIVITARHKISDCRKLQAEKKQEQANSASVKSNREKPAAFSAVYSSSVNQQDLWFADLSASEHMTNRREWFETFQLSKEEMNITLGNGQILHADGRRNICIESIVQGNKFENILTNALYVPGINKNLFSIRSVTDKGIEAKLVKDKLVLYLNNQIRAIRKRIVNKLYIMDWTIKIPVESNYATLKACSLNVWHYCFGHINFQSLKELAQGKSVTGFNYIDVNSSNNNQFCEACIFGKQCRKPFNESTNRATAPAELIHFDICGPMSVDSINGDKVMAVFVDNYSRKSS